jgi:hypothetical protein
MTPGLSREFGNLTFLRVTNLDFEKSEGWLASFELANDPTGAPPSKFNHHGSMLHQLYSLCCLSIKSSSTVQDSGMLFLFYKTLLFYRSFKAYSDISFLLVSSAVEDQIISRRGTGDSRLGFEANIRQR